MPKSSKIVECIGCKREFPRKSLNRNGRCEFCANIAGWDNMQQLKERSGPYYMQWKEACKAAAGRR